MKNQEKAFIDSLGLWLSFDSAVQSATQPSRCLHVFEQIGVKIYNKVLRRWLHELEYLLYLQEAPGSNPEYPHGSQAWLMYPH